MQVEDLDRMPESLTKKEELILLLEADNERLANQVDEIQKRNAYIGRILQNDRKTNLFDLSILC